MYKIIDTEANVNGTHLQGHISATYDALVERFGEPAYDSVKDGLSDKIYTEWTLEFENEEGDWIVATIYDWKEDSPYTSRSGAPYNWHIGGKSYEAVEAVYDYAKEVEHA